MSSTQKQQISNPLSKVFNHLESDLKIIDKIIVDNSNGEATLIADIAKHIISSGGKRVRPILTLLSAKVCNYNSDDNQHHNLAAAVELIHTATLLHDDVVDEGMLRRGTKTSNAIWGNKASILVGDYLLSTAFQLMVKSKSLKALDLLSHASKVMSDGEVMQLMNSTNINISKQQYIQIISQKTAILFAAATSVGAIISKADKKQEKALHDFGINLGITFQITDDILDYSSNQITFGKEIGNDFYEGKVTLPIIITYDKATQIEKNRIKKIFSQALMSKDKNQDLLSEMMCLIKKYNALALSIEESKSYHLKAIDNLSVFDDSKEKEMLISIINYVVTREK